MAIIHATIKAAGQRVFAVADWNAGHTIENNTINALMTDFIDDGTAAGQMLFWDGSKWTYAETTEIYWDDAAKELFIVKVDIDDGAIDGTIIGGATPAAGEFSTLGVNTNYDFPTIDGSNGDTLTTDGAASVSWKAGITGNTRIKAYKSADQLNIPAAWTKIQLEAEDYDTQGEFNTGTYRFTCTKAGYYLIHAQLIYSPVADGTETYVSIYDTGAEIVRNMAKGVEANDFATPQITTVRYLSVGDFIEVFGYADGIADVKGGGNLTWLEINFLGES